MLKSTLKTVKPSVIVKGKAKAVPAVVKRKLTGIKLQKMRHKIWLRDKGKCCHCEEVVESHQYELDHKTPLHLGGTDDEDNLQTLCIDCHKIKSAHEIGVYYGKT